jgi:DNA anti-recombination protein RmuC
LARGARIWRIEACHNASMTREELSELDRRIAISVARGEAAIARQEAAVARQQEATAEVNAINARMDRRLEQDEEDRGEFRAFMQEIRAENREMIADMRANRERWEEEARKQDGKLDWMIADLREGRDERRAVLECLLRMIDRLPPAKESG